MRVDQTLAVLEAAAKLQAIAKQLLELAEAQVSVDRELTEADCG